MSNNDIGDQVLGLLLKAAALAAVSEIRHGFEGLAIVSHSLDKHDVYCKEIERIDTEVKALVESMVNCPVPTEAMAKDGVQKAQAQHPNMKAFDLSSIGIKS